MKKIIAFTPELVESKNKQELFKIFSSYLKAIEEQNYIPIILPYNKNFTKILSICDGVILSGGGLYYHKNQTKYSTVNISKTNPKRYKFEKDLILYCLIKKIPLMGICRGAQTICQVLGGKINNNPKQDILKYHRLNEHPLEIINHGMTFSKLNKIKEFMSNSFHRKIIEKIPENCIITSISKKDKVIESFESKKLKIIATQFHPERLSAKYRKYIFSSFLKLANSR